MTTLERITASLNMLGMAPAQLAEQADIPLHISTLKAKPLQAKPNSRPWAMLCGRLHRISMNCTSSVNPIHPRFGL